MSSVLQSCLGDDDTPCINTHTMAVGRIGSGMGNKEDWREEKEQQRLQRVFSTSADGFIKRAQGSGSQRLKKQDDQEFSYEVGVESEQDRNQSQMNRQMQVRQSDDLLGGPGRNWRSNMMRVWGRRRR
jgi:hypothetical protein